MAHRSPSVWSAYLYWLCWLLLAVALTLFNPRQLTHRDGAGLVTSIEPSIFCRCRCARIQQIT